ncbi:MAG: hypothetical protein A3D92_13865, partial [Bacteroidetes bacterium RIFCSPHIGHO2_02_FULL_44_7]
MNDEDRLSGLLGDSDFEKLELWLKLPNFFSILQASRAELKHSNFLGWILDPKGTHGFGDLFLRKFLRDIFSDEKAVSYSQFDVDGFDLRDVEIRREWKHIDIVIIHAEFIVIIENKIDAQDHSDQLKRYRNTVEESFPNHKKVFVYLTPHGTVANDTESNRLYVHYSYESVSDALERILEIYQESLNDKVVHYLQDYLTILRRELMKSDQLNDLAVKVYKAHKEAFDFILENRPDAAAELYQYFETQIRDSKWILGAKNKGYARFLTPKLNNIIPKGYGTWGPDKESFLFEIEYFWSDKDVIFRTVITPGNPEINNILSQALESVQDHKIPRGKQWLVHFIKRWPFIASELA